MPKFSALYKTFDFRNNPQPLAFINIIFAHQDKIPVRNFFFPNSGFHWQFPVIARVKSIFGIPPFKMVKQIVFVESLANAGWNSKSWIFSFKKTVNSAEKRLFTAEAIFISVIGRPRNKSFFTSISDSMEFNPDTFKRNFAGADCGT